MATFDKKINYFIIIKRKEKDMLAYIKGTLERNENDRICGY